MNTLKPKILIISGPTAIGKSEISIALAHKFNAEIISADSMQIYRKMNIGTGKLTKDEMQGIKHHLIDVVDFDEKYSVAQFIQDAILAIEQILPRNKNVMIVGGTGLYLNALIHSYSLSGAQGDEKIREKYQQIAEKDGGEKLYQLLQTQDPDSAKKISPNDTRRVIRALEIFELTGLPKSTVAANNENIPYDFLQIVLEEERSKLYSHINRRVDNMIAKGLEKEVLSLYQKASHCDTRSDFICLQGQNRAAVKGIKPRSSAAEHTAESGGVRGIAPKFNTLYKNMSSSSAIQSLQAIGYKEFIEYFNNRISFEDTVAKIKQHSRNYAKRQITFFKWMKSNKIFIHRENETEIEQIAQAHLMKGKS